MKRIAKFHKVSSEQFSKDWKDTFGEVSDAELQNNTVGIIDSDYFFSDNEGHIFAKLTNDTREDKTIRIPAGTGFMQGIFVEYGITVDDDADAVRNGGFGSTTAKA